jgi:hypothetical protein
MQPIAQLEDAEPGVLGGNPDVAGQRQFKAGADDMTVQRRDHRLGHPVPAAGQAATQPHGGIAPRRHHVGAPPARDEALEVRAGAETAPGPGQDGDGGLVIGGEPVPDRGQSGVHPVVYRVQRRRPVQDHMGDPVGDRVARVGGIGGRHGHDRQLPGPAVVETGPTTCGRQTLA